jgi:hypothetical protein
MGGHSRSRQHDKVIDHIPEEGPGDIRIDTLRASRTCLRGRSPRRLGHDLL